MPRVPADSQTSAGFDSNLLAFTRELRAEGVAAGTAELLDAAAAIGHVQWSDRAAVHGALSATLAKSPEDLRIFEVVFERFFFRKAEETALQRGEEVAGKDPGGEQAQRIDLEALKQQIAKALQEGDEGSLRDMARLAVAAFGQTQGAAEWSESTYSESGGRWVFARSRSLTFRQRTQGLRESHVIDFASLSARFAVSLSAR
ncbi:MAG: hypothetical protein WCJ63_03045 [Actinomycetes bacterium]